MNSKTHVPPTVSASLEARLAPFSGTGRQPDPAAPGVPLSGVSDTAPRRHGVLRNLKLLIAALGAGNAAVPFGDNGRTTRWLAEYAKSLRRN